MSYNLEFLPIALKEWKKCGATIQVQFKKKLAERLKKPHVPSSKLSSEDNLYKIKLRASGYRLTFQVKEKEVVVLVISVGERDKSDVYNKMHQR